MKILCCLDTDADRATTAALLELGRRLSTSAIGEPGLIVAVASTEAPPAVLSLPGAGSPSDGTIPTVRWLRHPALSADNPRASGLALAHLAKHVDAKVCLASVSSRLRGLGIVPAALARHLGANFVALIDDAVFAQDALEVTLRLGPRRRRLRVPTPAVLTLATLGLDAAPPQTMLEVAPTLVTPADLGLDPALLNGRRELLGDHTPVASAPRYVTRARDLLG